MPAKLVSPAEPVLRVEVLAATPLVTRPPVVPPPAREPIVSLVPFRFSVAPETFAIDTALVSGIAEPPETCKVPALIVVAPV